MENTDITESLARYALEVGGAAESAMFEARDIIEELRAEVHILTSGALRGKFHICRDAEDGGCIEVDGSQISRA